MRDIVASGLVALATATATAAAPFRITVVDDQTGRGVPLVELRTVNEIRYVTDCRGVVAFDEPALLGRTVFFHVRGHGYEFPKDGFGYRGKALETREGGEATLRIKRVNVAERLYRVTGEGIYRDSLLTGLPAPIPNAGLNAKVLGSDSVVTEVLGGRMYWFWGDTNRPEYPLGNFHVPGATSRLPDMGGLDPEVGVALDYFVDDKGFARETAHMPGAGPTWIDGLIVLRDRSGRERMFAAYVKIRNMLEAYERGLVEFDDGANRFEKVATFDLDAPIHPGGHPFLDDEGGPNHVYFARPFPLVRVPADPESLAKTERYEAYTCLESGTRVKDRRIDRAPDGSVRYAWKANTAPVGPAEQNELIKAGLLKPEEALLQLRDVETGKPVTAHGGSVYWNNYRRRYVLIAVEAGGSSSYLGEVWFAEARTILGPWTYARKVVTHDRYSFYNPKQHPWFSKDDGRIIFFEGTYSATFSGNPEPTPRYDYNQVMYKLDQADPRLALPVPIHINPRWRLLDVDPDRMSRKLLSDPVVFYAPDQPAPGTVPVFVVRPNDADHFVMTLDKPPGMVDTLKGPRERWPLFHAIPPGAADPPSGTVPLYEFTPEKGDVRAYSTDSSLTMPGYRRSERPLCRVWPNPKG
jgi:hypothetical protein